jgi:hypothetical protein
MRALVVLVSSNQGAWDVFLRKKDAVIPKSLRDLPRIKAIGLDFATGFYDPLTSGRSLEDYVLEAAKGADMVALLVDAAIEHLAVTLAPACLVGRVSYDPMVKTYDNFISAQLTKLIKNLASVAEWMSSAGNQLPLFLPLRNFTAPEWARLQAVFRDEGIDGNLPQKVGELIKGINKRKRPHKRATSQQTYLVDDDDKLFDYGKERHAQLATGNPHTSMCVLTGNFRFGWRIPTDRHYNVTKEAGALTKIAGSFPDCHGAMNQVAERSHLNMFSNDYHT